MSKLIDGKMRSMEARSGREKQCYTPSGARIVAGTVPLNADKSKVLMISSMNKKKWVLPKGGMETDEPTCEEAALRESWEEAGISGKIIKTLPVFLSNGDWSKETNINKKNPGGSSEYHFFEMIVQSEESEWPEASFRKRKWFTYSEAVLNLKSRPELQNALENSSLAR